MYLCVLCCLTFSLTSATISRVTPVPISVAAFPAINASPRHQAPPAGTNNAHNPFLYWDKSPSNQEGQWIKVSRHPPSELNQHQVYRYHGKSEKQPSKHYIFYNPESGYSAPNYLSQGSSQGKYPGTTKNPRYAPPKNQGYPPATKGYPPAKYADNKSEYRTFINRRHKAGLKRQRLRGNRYQSHRSGTLLSQNDYKGKC